MTTVLAIYLLLNPSFDELHECIMQVESNKKVNVISSTGDYGIGQINRLAHPDFDYERMLGDKEYSIQASRKVLKQTLASTAGLRGNACAYNVGVRAFKNNVKPTACRAYLRKINRCLVNLRVSGAKMEPEERRRP